MEICWAILRYYDYDDQLSIIQSKWDDETIPDNVLEEARSFELGQSSKLFLVDLFNTYKNEKS